MSTILPRAAFGLGLCLFIGAPALAEPETQSLIVRTTDLDLASASGRAALHHRVGHAITQICGAASDVRDLAVRASVLACRSTAHVTAAPKVEVATAAARSAIVAGIAGAAH